MNERAESLIEAIERKTNDVKIETERLQSYQASLNCIQSSCKHNWTDAEKHTDTIPGYTTPGDKPGTMGVDFQGPVDIAPSVKVYYTRECKECGKTQRTEQTRPGKQVPSF